jgi:uncharacterized protein YcgI (DUF1989 family)
MARAGLAVKPPLSKAGDHIVLEAEQDRIIALTACSALQSHPFRDCRPIDRRDR